MSPSKRVVPNLKLYSPRFLSEFYENGKQNLPTLTNDWVIDYFVIILSQNKGGQITRAPPTNFQHLNNPPV